MKFLICYLINILGRYINYYRNSSMGHLTVNPFRTFNLPFFSTNND